MPVTYLANRWIKCSTSLWFRALLPCPRLLSHHRSVCNVRQGFGGVRNSHYLGWSQGCGRTVLKTGHPRLLHDALNASASNNLLDRYSLLHQSQSNALGSFTFNENLQMLRTAFLGKNILLLEVMVKDLLTNRLMDSHDRLLLLQAVLDCEYRDNVLSLSSIAQIAQFWLSDMPDSIPVKTLSTFARAAFESDPLSGGWQPQVISQLVSSVLPHTNDTGGILAYNAFDFSTSGSEQVQHLPHTWLLFRCLLHLLIVDDRKLAVALFQRLMDARHFAAGSLVPVNGTGEDTFYGFIVTALVRSCLEWNWSERAILILSLVIGKQLSTSSQFLATLTFDVLEDLLRNARNEVEINRAAKLMCQFAKHHQDCTIPYSIVERFYETARILGAPTAASEVHETLTGIDSNQPHKYPPPKGAVLPWLFNWYIHDQHDMQAARALIRNIYDRHDPIDLSHLPMTIKLCAQAGFIRESRGLWLKYTSEDSASERTRIMLYGSSMAMRALVSLFVRASQKAALFQDWTARDTIGYGSTVDEMEDHGGDPDEYLEFARLVVAKFRQAKEPLIEASRSDLNALSRSYFELEHVDEALDTMKNLLRRHEIPTQRDLGVVLAGMASCSPRRAARMVQEMLDRGLQPQACDFGVVIHEAALRGDDQLVGALVSKSHEAGYEQLSAQAMHSLLRFSIRSPQSMWNERNEEQYDTLRRVLQTIKTLGKKQHILTPRTGARFVRGCLRVNQSKLAFEFWDLLVRGKEERDHAAQERLRRNIATHIKRDMRRGWLAGDEGNWMLSKLGVVSHGKAGVEMRRLPDRRSDRLSRM